MIKNHIDPRTTPLFKPVLELKNINRNLQTRTINKPETSYRFREAILQSKRLKRALTKEEMMQFEAEEAVFSKPTECDIIIDDLTDCLTERKTGELFATEFRMVRGTIHKSDANNLKKEGWLFDWSVPHKNNFEVYELLLENDDMIQGLIALRHDRYNYYTEVELVEVAPSNRGSEGIFKGVGAHLFAIACKLSTDVGNEGYVRFTAKTKLIEHYKNTLGAKHIRDNIMYIDSVAANKLLSKYFIESI